MKGILVHFDIPPETYSVTPFGSGLINHTWKVTGSQKDYILQQINTNVFKDVPAIENNIRRISDHIQQNFPGILFAAPVPLLGGGDVLYEAGAAYRLFPFIKGSHTVDTVENPQQAYEAAFCFGRFTQQLSGLDPALLKNTIPHFHDLELRYEQFEQALATGNIERINDAKVYIHIINENAWIIDRYRQIKNNPAFKLRIMHHDTKISNVLFDEQDKSICVIDLDTVMPGYFISDVGDMMRTYLSAANEEATDLSSIEIRQPFYDAIVQGYEAGMQGTLTAAEQNSFLYAGQFMAYMQAMRFLTDHLMNDIYYGAKYEGHNKTRAANQLRLLELMIEFEKNIGV